MLHFDLQLPSSIKFQNLCLFQSLQSPNNSNKLKTSTESQYFNLELFNHASSSSFSIQFQSLPLAISSFTLLNSNKEFLCSLGNPWKPRAVEWSNLIYLTTKLLANFNGLLLGCIQTNLTQTKWSDLINLTLYLLAIPKGSVLGCILTDFCKYAGFSTRLASPPLTSSALTLNSSRSPSIFVVLSQSFSLFLALSLSLSLFIYLSIYMYIYLRLQLNTLSADSFNNKKERIFHQEPIPRARSQNRQNLISPRFRRSSPIFNRSSKSAARTSTHHPCVWRSPLPPP